MITVEKSAFFPHNFCFNLILRFEVARQTLIFSTIRGRSIRNVSQKHSRRSCRVRLFVLRRQTKRMPAHFHYPRFERKQHDEDGDEAVDPKRNSSALVSFEIFEIKHAQYDSKKMILFACIRTRSDGECTKHN